MEAIIINKKIKLVEDSTIITVTINVPFLNIQKMKELTKCSILSVKETFLKFKNNAGKIAEVTIRVKFINISDFITNVENIANADNKECYLNMISINENKAYCFNWFPQFKKFNLRTLDIFNLYAFGYCYKESKPNFLTYIYINKLGKKISLYGVNKKYLKFKGEYFKLIN